MIIFNISYNNTIFFFNFQVFGFEFFYFLLHLIWKYTFCENYFKIKLKSYNFLFIPKQFIYFTLYLHYPNNFRQNLLIFWQYIFIRQIYRYIIHYFFAPKFYYFDISANIIPPATDTFSEFISPFKCIFTILSQCSLTFFRIPFPSLPSTRHAFSG